MNTMKKFTIATVSLFAAALLFAGCAALDVTKTYAGESLDDILAAYPSLLVETDSAAPYMGLSADGETRLLVSGDFSKSGDEDVLIQTPLAPFLDAGLDTGDLPAGFRADDASLYAVLGAGEGTGAKDGFTEALFEAVEYDRALLSYHGELDHFGVALTGGKFEWAKDYTNNDKDLVFVLDAEALRDVGVDVANVSGWVLMTMQDEGGNDFDVLLKPYSLEA